MSTPPLSSRISAFSLPELLAVMAIIALLTAFIMPAMNNISGGTNLTAATEELASVVNLARQRASTFNRQVALRFWKNPTSGDYSSFQLWEAKDFPNPSATDPDANWTPLDRERPLPNGIIVMDTAQHSSLLHKFPELTQSSANGGRKFREILFTPAGSLVAEADENAITLISKHVASGTTLPKNFGTVVIEPFNSIPTVYRPQ